jgi:hypothetical protein
LTAPRTAAWLDLLQQLQKVTAGQPTAKLRKELDTSPADIGPATLKATHAEEAESRPDSGPTNLRCPA